jgi:hypothetical protein
VKSLSSASSSPKAQPTRKYASAYCVNGNSQSLSRESQESNQKLPDRRWYPNVGSGRTPLDDYRVGRACAAVIGRRLCRMLFHASRDAFSLHGKLPQDSWEFHFSTSLRRRFTMVLIVATAALPTGVVRRVVHAEKLAGWITRAVVRCRCRWLSLEFVFDSFIRL